MAFIRFLEGCLRWDPTQRFSPDEALQHGTCMWSCGHVGVRACTCECVRAIAHSITCGLCGQSGYWRAQFL